jgi:nucleoside-diphosphate-sugar epimerase
MQAWLAILGVAVQPRKAHALGMNEDLHVVLGSGQIGALVADDLLARGTRVRLVRRGPAGPPRSGLEWLSGDLSDLAFAEEATRGAAVVYDCTSPPYDRWLTLLMPLARGAMHGAAKAGAKLVALDNLYMYGRARGPIAETSPIAPCSRKGELRARLAEERRLAHARGDVRVATGRASDFFGPGVVRQTTFGDRFFRRVFAGKAAECFGDPDAPHALSYAPDVATALVTLADHDEAFGEVWHLPTNPPESMRRTTEHLAFALGFPIAVTRVPRLALRAMGLFNPLAREVAEMAYQWDEPYVVDDAKFRAAFGGAPTPRPAILGATAAWAASTYGTRARAA